MLVTCYDALDKFFVEAFECIAAFSFLISFCLRSFSSSSARNFFGVLRSTRQTYSVSSNLVRSSGQFFIFAGVQGTSSRFSFFGKIRLCRVQQSASGNFFFFFFFAGVRKAPTGFFFFFRRIRPGGVLRAPAQVYLQSISFLQALVAYH